MIKVVSQQQKKNVLWLCNYGYSTEGNNHRNIPGQEYNNLSKSPVPALPENCELCSKDRNPTHCKVFHGMGINLRSTDSDTDTTGYGHVDMSRCRQAEQNVNFNILVL